MGGLDHSVSSKSKELLDSASRHRHVCLDYSAPCQYKDALKVSKGDHGRESSNQSPTPSPIAASLLRIDQDFQIRSQSRVMSSLSIDSCSSPCASKSILSDFS